VTASARPSFDAVIVGAGLAGSAAAILLARAGWAVALIERQRFPRRKVCGECLAASNWPVLQALGIADAFRALAGSELKQVTLMHGRRAVTADLPPALDPRHAWGRALGREVLDTLLLEQARAEGATVFQPCAVQEIRGVPGEWQCELRMMDSRAPWRVQARVVIDAHGSWEDLPTDRPKRRLRRNASDLFAFKANFKGSSLCDGSIGVLALDGGYGGMVRADSGLTTVACCLRRDRLSAIRLAAPGVRAGEAVQDWLQQECAGVQQALQGAERDGPWLSAGPLEPGVHLRNGEGIFRIGNAAGEAHPILGEGMSMALQSAALLGIVLLSPSGVASAPAGRLQAELNHRYAAAWRKAFVPRLRLAAAFAHAAMRPLGATWLMRVSQAWPGLLTAGARWGGKVHSPSSGLAVPAGHANATSDALMPLAHARVPHEESS
jgi:2-polyprenyl-6-methoxyphenol hydroxylase-like FAD-dependent oxidoreductase